MNNYTVEIYTDGACSPNPGAGGCAAVLVAYLGGKYQTHKIVSAHEADTTNNRMEICAVIIGLQALKRPTTVTVISDSQYVVNVASGLYRGSSNKDLWQQLRQAEQRHCVSYEWVRGHNGNRWNELAHDEANAAIQRLTA